MLNSQFSIGTTIVQSTFSLLPGGEPLASPLAGAIPGVPENVFLKSYKIAVIGGAGTGPEVVSESVKVLEAAAKKFTLKLDFTHSYIGGPRASLPGRRLPVSVLCELT